MRVALLLRWVHDWGHLHVFLLAEAEHFAVLGYLEFDTLGFHDTRQRLRTFVECTSIMVSAVT